MDKQAEAKQETLLQAVLIELSKINATVQAVAETTASIAASLVNGHGPGPDTGPNFQRALPEYPTFDWEAIGAEIVKWDRHGATVVKWQGLEFFRRRHTDYDASVWFSRYTGQKDENDRKVYARLITFSDRPRIVKSLPDEVADRLPEPPAKPRKQEPPASPSTDDQQPASNIQQPVNPRVAFYQLLPQLIRTEKLTAEGANQLANLAKRKGYPVALATAQELSNVAADKAQDHPQGNGSDRSSQGNTPSRSSTSRSSTSRSLASCPQDSQKLRMDTERSDVSTAAAAANLLYPKNELDAFFPRE